MKKNRLIILALFLLLASALSACSGGSLAATSWPGVSVDTDRSVAYVAYNQHVYAVDLANGTEKWRYPAEADNKITFFAAPTLTADGQLLAGSYDGTLYSLNPDSGQVNWSFGDANNRYIGSALANSQFIYAPNADQSLYALDLAGKEVWKFRTKQSLWAKPAKNGETLYIPSMDHNLYALDAQNGKLIWETGDLEGALVGTPALGGNGEVYVGSFGYEMLAIDSKDGSILWRAPTDGWVWAGPLLEDGTLYFGDLNGHFYALNATDGSKVWDISPGEGPVYAISDRPLVINEKLYYTSENGDLYAVDKADGNALWTRTIGGKLYGSPKQAGDSILIAPVDTEELLVAMDENGNQQWKFTPAK